MFYLVETKNQLNKLTDKLNASLTRSLRGYDFDQATNSFQATGEDRLIQFKGLCDISTNNQICMLPHNLKAYDNLILLWLNLLIREQLGNLYL